MKTTLKNYHFAFQMSKKIVFEVSYYTLNQNKNPYFTTSAAEYNQPKTDYIQCGQAQNSLLKGYPVAMNFFNKWDIYHLQKLTKKQLNELFKDIETLKQKYNFIEQSFDISFERIKELSKLNIKKA